MMKSLMSLVADRILSRDFAHAFATAQTTRAYNFSTIWNVSGKEA